jgi:pilus assembly protein CpaB
MKLRIILLIVAIIIGIVAVVAIVSYISSIRTSVEKEVEKVEVLVAAQNIPGEVPVEVIISSEAVVLEAVPQKYLANGVLTTLEDYEGYVTSAPINKGEQITTTNFVKPEQIGLAFTIPDDMVAISIPIDEIIGVSYLINVGDMVNVIATFSPPGEEEEETETGGEALEEAEEFETLEEVSEAGITEEITKTLLWNVEVLHIGIRSVARRQDIQIEEEETGTEESGVEFTEIRTATLALTPEQAEKLVFTEEHGSVWLALLPVDGVEKTDTEGQTYKNIFEE